MRLGIVHRLEAPESVRESMTRDNRQSDHHDDDRRTEIALDRMKPVRDPQPGNLASTVECRSWGRW